MYESYLKVIDDKAAEVCAVSDYLWTHPETAYGEFEGSAMLADKLEEFGFEVKRGVAGIPTAFTASYGSGKPHFGVLAEYDGLSGMSQEAGVTEPRSIPNQDNGHGCGHNLFAGGSVAAVLAVKAYIEEKGAGKVTLFGCPAEEGGGGKVFMVRAGVFEGVDAIVSWHPEKMYQPRTRIALANVKVKYKFIGTPSHAGASPHLGRSALDALELMNVGTNFLREHMELTSRVHYAILDAGGTAANQVQSHAEALYMIRAVDADAVRELHARIDRIAQGAALMTDTTVTSKVVAGYSNIIIIPTLVQTAYEAMLDTPLPVADEQEQEYARRLRENMPLMTKKEKEMPLYADHVNVPPPPMAHGGSTDTADVSWNCPTVQMHIGTWAIGTPGHSWQVVSQGKGSYAKKAMLYAGKAVAGTIFRLFENPELVKKAWEEHFEQTGGNYICPIPDDVQPSLVERK